MTSGATWDPAADPQVGGRPLGLGLRQGRGVKSLALLLHLPLDPALEGLGVGGAVIRIQARLRAICSWRMNAWRRKCSSEGPRAASGPGVGARAVSSGSGDGEGSALTSLTLATTGPDEEDVADEGAGAAAVTVSAGGGACWGCTGARLTGGFFSCPARNARGRSG